MKINSLIIVFGMTVAAITTNASSAHAFSLFTNNRSEFNNSLNHNPLSTITDNGTSSFGGSPASQSGLDKVTRTGLIYGSTFSYNIYDINFSETPTGKLTPGIANDIFSLSTLRVEKPVNQDGVKGIAAWGVDSQGNDNNSTRNAALFDFTTTRGNAGIGHFGVELYDFESDSAFRLAELRLYKSGSLIYNTNINWGSGANGDKESHFLGVVANSSSEYFDQVVVVLGDDSTGKGWNEAWAADNFTFGQASHAPLQKEKEISEIPEPSTIAGILFVLGIGALSRKQK
jgi:hypothetical protein